jgi:uncharacterized protein YcsI (UPF0317 family)
VDLGGYHVYRDGVMVADVDSLEELWTPNLVGFLLGCSFTFEAALMQAGVPVRNIELGSGVPMFRTNRACEAVGPFHGPLVVSMRPIPEGLVERAAATTARYPRAHGAPVHVGDPAALGIADLSRPDYGVPLPLYPGEVPVFWACGVTPQAVAQAAGIDLMLTHRPGHMFVTDLHDSDFDDGPRPKTPASSAGITVNGRTD